MKNPRSIYLQSCFQCYNMLKFNNISDIDYFDYTKFELDSNPSNKQKKLSELLTKGIGSTNLVKAYKLFQDLNNRVTIEGLLLSYPINIVSQINNMPEDLLNIYKDYFFNTENFESEIEKEYFYRSIKNEVGEKVKLWFYTCLQTPPEEMNYLGNKKPIKENVTDMFNYVLSSEYSIYRTFMNIDLKSAQEGLNIDQKERFAIASKAKYSFIQMMNMFLKNKDKLGEKEDDFLTNYQLLLDEVRARDFEVKIEDEQEDLDLKRQLSELNALSEDEQVVIDKLATHLKDKFKDEPPISI